MLYKWNHTVCNFFEIGFFSHSIMSLSSIQGVTYIDGGLLLIVEKHSIVWMYRSLFNHSPVEGYLGCFQFLTMNKAAINIYIQVFV